MPPKVPCPACKKLYTPSGLTNHISQTRQKSCAALQRDFLSNTRTPSPPADQAPTDPLSVHMGDVDMEAEPIPFAGDFFGQYDASFFDDTVVEELAPGPDDSESSEDEGDDGAGNDHWEPRPSTPPASQPHTPPVPSPVPLGPALPTNAHRATAESSVKRKTVLVPFPRKSAGAAVDPAKVPEALAHASTYNSYRAQVESDSSQSNPYAPFTSRLDWQIARWAKLRGSGSTSFSDLLAIEEVAARLELSYKNSRELNQVIDKKLPQGRPKFQRHEIIVGGEAFEVFWRDILECVEALFGDPEFAPLLLLVPERHYADDDQTVRVYFDMNTGKWWWSTQKELEKSKPGATVIPIIISSDKTQLTVFGNKTAYPVYMTLGNLPKEVRAKPSRGGQILLAYLPTTRLLHISNKAARRRMLANLFHTCMKQVLAPLSSAGLTGIYLASGDGVVRRGHPILAVYVGDYPEQVLVTGCKTGECPKCPLPRNEIGDDSDTLRPLRHLGKVLDALDALDQGPQEFRKACADAGIKPLTSPFWAELPYTNIYYAITPDLLHQLYQGVMKHLVAWLQEAYGEQEIDARCRRLPPNHHIRHFAKGISSLNRVTGKEHQDMCRILLGLIIGLPLPNGVNPSRLVRATRAILDFLYLAQYTTHTTKTLALLKDALAAFHANKDIFVDLGIRSHFHLPKLHSLDHYPRSIELFGTTDNYDTQYSERLHIDFTKDAYRATNKKDELAQMTKWLERREKIQRHEKYINWRLEQLQPEQVALTQQQQPRQPPDRLDPAPLSDPPPSLVQGPTAASGVERSSAAPAPRRTGAASCGSPQPRAGRPRDPVDKPRRRIEMTRHPSASVKLEDLALKYGATFFRDALTRFVVKLNSPELTAAQQERASASVYLNFSKVPAYHKVKFWLADPHSFALPGSDVRDVIHIKPARKNKHGGQISGRFDTALLRIPNDEHVSVQRFSVAQVRLVFKLPDKAAKELFPRLPVAQHPKHLAYVEWFTPFDDAHPDHGLYKVRRSLQARTNARLASIIPIELLERSCHLFPEFGPVAPREWTTDNVLDRASAFYVNTFSDRHMYKLVF